MINKPLNQSKLRLKSK